MNMTEKNKFVCHDCFELKKCKDPTISWVFFLIALIATVSVRAVNVVLDFNPLLAKLFWYVGIGGFTVFFIYKFRNDNILQKELTRNKITDRLLRKEKLSDADYEVLGTILCKMSSKKDKVTYFFIFLSSALALGLAAYVDFFKK